MQHPAPCDPLSQYDRHQGTAGGSWPHKNKCPQQPVHHKPAAEASFLLTEFQPAYSQLRADKYFSRSDQKKLSKTTLVIKFCKAVNVHLELRKNIHF